MLESTQRTYIVVLKFRKIFVNSTPALVRHIFCDSEVTLSGRLCVLRYSDVKTTRVVPIDSSCLKLHCSATLEQILSIFVTPLTAQILPDSSYVPKQADSYDLP